MEAAVAAVAKARPAFLLRTRGGRLFAKALAKASLPALSVAKKSYSIKSRPGAAFWRRELGVAVREIRACAALSEFFALVCCTMLHQVGHRRLHQLGGHGGGAPVVRTVGPSCLCYSLTKVAVSVQFCNRGKLDMESCKLCYRRWLQTC